MISWNIVSWNCKGAGGNSFVKQANDLVISHGLGVLVIVEPRISARKAEMVTKKLNLDSSLRLDSHGLSRGIWLLWNKSWVQISVI